MCGDNDFVMCDVPAKSMDLLVAAWNDFKCNPSDGLKFNSLDWVIRTTVAKWEDYASIRRANSA